MEVVLAPAKAGADVNKSFGSFESFGSFGSFRSDRSSFESFDASRRTIRTVRTFRTIRTTYGRKMRTPARTVRGNPVVSTGVRPTS